jgi:hypothetical protein
MDETDFTDFTHGDSLMLQYRSASHPDDTITRHALVWDASPDELALCVESFQTPSKKKNETFTLYITPDREVINLEKRGKDDTVTRVRRGKEATFHPGWQ